MLKKLFLFIILLTAVIKVKAQESFISYNNDTEKLLFKGVTNSDDCLKLTLAADLSDAGMRKYYGNLVNDAKLIGIELDKITQTEKKVQKIKDALHGSYLRNLNPPATFNDVFTNGSYNPVQAVILYAWFLDQYHIPYEFREGVGKLYVLAYPLTSKIELVGVDNPQTVPEDAMNNYALDLVKLKYITEDYLRQVGSVGVFTEFFYSKGALSVKALAGYYYFNRASINLQLNKTELAYSDVIKATVLSGLKKCEVLQKGILLQIIPSLKFRDVRDWEAGVYALNNIPVEDQQRKYIDYEFQEALQDLLWKQSKVDEIERIHKYISTTLKDTAVRNAIDELYYTETGRYYITSNKFPEALQSLSKVLERTPDNLPVKRAVVDIVLRRLTLNTGSINNLTALDQAVKDFTFLAEDQAIQRQYIYNYAFLSGTAFSRADKNNGEKYQKLMCAELQSIKPGTQMDVEYAGEAFVKASEYYYSKQGKQKALQVLNDGLKYVPNSIYITQRIKFIKSGTTVQSHSSAYDKLKIFNQ